MVSVVDSAYALLVPGLDNTVRCIHHVTPDEEDEKLISGIFGLGYFDPIKCLEASKIVAPIKTSMQKTVRHSYLPWTISLDSSLLSKC